MVFTWWDGLPNIYSGMIWIINFPAWFEQQCSLEQHLIIQRVYLRNVYILGIEFHSFLVE
jgi:hypothetical protein